MVKRFFSGIRNVRQPVALNPSPVEGVNVNVTSFVLGTNNSSASWSGWLSRQRSPLVRPNTNLWYNSIYMYGQDLEEGITVDLCERWYYCLNIPDDSPSAIADAALPSPTTRGGRLLKRAIQNPSKYPIIARVDQLFPANTVVPEGYIKTANGEVTGLWSPIATPAAMAAAVDFKMAGFRRLAATGAKIAIAYDGGETGLAVPIVYSSITYPLEAGIATAKGSDSWPTFISKAKGVQQRLIYDAVKAAAPDRQCYTYYPNVDYMYSNIPGSDGNGWDYAETFNIADVASSSSYYRDAYAPTAGMSNPAVRYGGSYYDTLTQTLSAVAGQIKRYDQPLSYNYVSGGYCHKPNDNNPKNQPEYFMSDVAFYGFLKCMFALGTMGAVLGYFSPDCALGTSFYTPYDPLDPPSWLLQLKAVGDVSGYMSWVDEFLPDGDLLPGVGTAPIKQYYPRYEYDATKRIGAFYLPDGNDVRVLVRKLRVADKWLIVLAVAENADGTIRADRDVFVSGVPGLKSLRLRARAKGSIYTVDKTSGTEIVTWRDAPVPDPTNVPTLKTTSANPASVRLDFTTLHGFNAGDPPPLASFSMSGGTIGSISVYEKYLLLNAATSYTPGVSTVTYNGVGLRDTETNTVAAFTASVDLPLQIFTSLAAGITFESGAYTANSGTNWLTSTMVADRPLVGDVDVLCRFKGQSMIALSPEATNVGSYQSWAYAANSGQVAGSYVLSAHQSGVTQDIDPGANLYRSFDLSYLVRLSRTSGIVKLSIKAADAVTWTDVYTYPNLNTQPLYLHGAFGSNGSQLLGLTLDEPSTQEL